MWLIGVFSYVMYVSSLFVEEGSSLTWSEGPTAATASGEEWAEDPLAMDAEEASRTTLYQQVDAFLLKVWASNLEDRVGRSLRNKRVM